MNRSIFRGETMHEHTTSQDSQTILLFFFGIYLLFLLCIPYMYMRRQMGRCLGLSLSDKNHLSSQTSSGISYIAFLRIKDSLNQTALQYSSSSDFLAQYPNTTPAVNIIKTNNMLPIETKFASII